MQVKRTSEPAPCLLTHSACVNPPLRVLPYHLGSSPACLAAPPPAVSLGTKRGPRAKHASTAQTARPACMPMSQHKPLPQVTQGHQCSLTKRGFVPLLPPITSSNAEFRTNVN